MSRDRAQRKSACLYDQQAGTVEFSFYLGDVVGET
jgi:hypothetical protein